MTSAARIAANRLNAQKSTGPKSREGKERSRQNALQHGLRAEVLELPGEGEVIQARVTEWTGALRPRDAVDRWLVARAAAASVRLDRCTELEAARVDQRMRNARDKFLRDGQTDALRLGLEMEEDPRLLGELRASSFGCGWLLGEWAELDQALGGPHGWTMGEPIRACQLLGIPADAVDPDPQLVGLFEQSERHHAGDKQAGQHLRELVRAAIADLKQLRDELWEEVDGPALRAAVELARFDGTARAGKMQRYESAHSAELHRCLRLLKARPAAPNEANDRTQSVDFGGVAPVGRGPVGEPPGAEAAASGASQTSPQPPEDASNIHDPSIQNPSSPHPSPAAPNEPNAKAQPSGKPKASVPMEWRTRLAVNPAISRAWPVVKGTSITASQIGSKLTPPNAMTREQLVAHYEGRITLEDIQAACDFLNDRGGIGHYED